ncbi:ankyrin repeat family protein [Tasmannia lanceolata]|uniref:ankyrin repeat family protein n=1 Tax=Tasmannia lanceolata TaxID=3420 RepID=UPI004062ABBA
MAVPHRRNGLMEDGEEEEEGLFEEEEQGWLDLDVDPPPHLRALTEAAQLGNVEALRHAIDNLNAGSIDDPVEDGDTALHLSCLYGYLPCVQLLLERGASLETKDDEGAIPLHDACAGGFTEIVRLLIDAANSPDSVKRILDTVDAEGDTPLHHAARGEHLDVVRLLLTAGASPRKTNIFGKTPAELSDAETEVRSILEEAAAAFAADAVGCQ